MVEIALKEIAWFKCKSVGKEKNGERREHMEK